MSTPSEEEARALIAEARTAILTMDYERAYQGGLVGRLADALASRVSAPPSEDWEYAYSDGTPGDLPTSNVVNTALTPIPGFLVLRRRKAGEWEPVPAVPVLPTDPPPCTPASPSCIGSERGGACSCNDDPEEKR